MMSNMISFSLEIDLLCGKFYFGSPELLAGERLDLKVSVIKCEVDFQNVIPLRG